MKILIADPNKIPALKYGGTQRVVWGLGKTLAERGHEVYFLAGKGSHCPFAKAVYPYDPARALDEQIPGHVDLVHFNFQPGQPVRKPYLTTFHGNINTPFNFDRNTVFISHNQAVRYHGSVVVHNGLDWSLYPSAGSLDRKRDYFHFLGDASWKVKNVKGAVAITKTAGEKLVVIGGRRLNFNMGFRFTTDLHVRFMGSVDDTVKARVLSRSKGLLFPVLWHEPFGLAIIESMYYGCPVFGTRFGSLPELVTADTGFLSNSRAELASALASADRFSPQACHTYAAEGFNAGVMTDGYIALYEKILNGASLHDNAPFIPEAELIPVKRFTMDA